MKRGGVLCSKCQKYRQQKTDLLCLNCYDKEHFDENFKKAYDFKTESKWTLTNEYVWIDDGGELAVQIVNLENCPDWEPADWGTFNKAFEKCIHDNGLTLVYPGVRKSNGETLWKDERRKRIKN